VWYNRANLLAHQKDYQAAVVNYTKAIELEDDFSEAYFNRALTYLLLNQRDKAIADLSKAGELGIYKAYSILKKIQNK
jgi:tetratricopeptide (TPR) repeat protein